MTHKIMKTGVPRNIYATIGSEFPYRTRQATQGNLRMGEMIILATTSHLKIMLELFIIKYRQIFGQRKYLRLKRKSRNG